MKTPLKYLTIAGLAITALTWPSLELSATEVEDEHETSEDIAAREAYRRLQLQDENGQIPPDAWINAYAEKDTMRFLPEAWERVYLSRANRGRTWRRRLEFDWAR